MSQDAADMPAMRDDAHHIASQSIPAEQAAPTSLRRVAAHGTLSNAALATQCLGELGNYQRSEPCEETYGLELFRRATLQGDPEAWVQDCFRVMVRGWLRRHPSREAALSFESEENYVALAFERFWQATSGIRDVRRGISLLTCESALSHPGYTTGLPATKRSAVATAR